MKRIGKNLIPVLLAMLLCASCALADAPLVSSVSDFGISDGEAIYELTHQGADYRWSIVHVNQETGEETVVAASEEDLTEDTVILWDEAAMGVADDGLYCNGKGEIYYLLVEVDGWVEAMDSFFVRRDVGGAATLEKAQWLSNNTVCSVGPRFQDVRDALTDEWYMFSVVDLSENGMQSFDLVAGGIYVVGEVYVTVKDDSVHVTYAYDHPDEIYETEKFFRLFTDLDSMDTVHPEDLESMEYGAYYSISEDLGGDTTVLLFTCNRVSFMNSTPGLTRFYESLDDYEELLEDMLAQLEEDA